MKNIFLILVIPAISIFGCTSQQGKDDSSTIQNDTLTTKSVPMAELNDSIVNYIVNAETNIETIDENRKVILEKIADYIVEKKKSGSGVNLTFICTHNSRRSHLSQIWATTAAHYFGVADGIATYSGGTEATAFNPRAVAAMERAGYRIENPGGDNPHYKVYFSDKLEPLDCFSKIFDHEVNPKESFAAVMVCSEAAEDCPYVPGTEMRIPLTYEDPKVADDTEHETEKYDERNYQIATEMLYVMSQVRAQL
jgi:arsenate reductase (thioredoxin)